MSEMTATRIARAATIPVAVALWLLAAWLLWRTRVPTDLRLLHVDPRRVVGPAGRLWGAAGHWWGRRSGLARGSYGDWLAARLPLGSAVGVVVAVAVAV